MSNQEDKAYYRINDPDAKESEGGDMSTGSKRSKKKLIIIISCIVVVCIAVAVLLMILLLGSDSGAIPSGYNGFVKKSETNLKYAYYANIQRENDADYPVEFGENNPEFTDVDFSI